MNIRNLRTLPALMAKDCMAMRVPILATLMVGIGCYLLPLITQLAVGPVETTYEPAVSPPTPMRASTSAPTITPMRARPMVRRLSRQWTLSPAATFDAAQVGIVVTAILAAVFGGIAIAGERAERTAEFLAMLPVTRGQIAASKIFVGVCVIAACTLVHAGIAATASWISSHWMGKVDLAVEALLLPASICCFFGVAWLVGTFSRSTPISACASIAVTLGVLIVSDVAQGSWWSRSDHVKSFWDTPLALASPVILIGVVSLVGGTGYYLRRIAP